MMRFLFAILVLVLPGVSSAFTIATGGNMEDKAVMVDQMSVDMCSAVYDCGAVKYVSEAGKNGDIAPGTFDKEHLKAAYANKADKSDYADYTEKAPWADSNLNDQTKMTKAFTATSIYEPIADKAENAELAFGADSAPSAEQSLVVFGAESVDDLRQTEFYSSANSAGVVARTNAVTFFEGGGMAGVSAEVAKEWTRTDTTTHY